MDARFDVLSTAITDRGAEFKSHDWDALINILGSLRIRTCPVHIILRKILKLNILIVF